MPRGSSKCTRVFLSIALLITAVVPSARGQCPTPTSIPNASVTGVTPLTVQTPDGVILGCGNPPGDPESPNTVAITITGAPGTWVYVHVRAFIELPPNPSSAQV